MALFQVGTILYPDLILFLKDESGFGSGSGIEPIKLIWISGEKVFDQF